MPNEPCLNFRGELKALEGKPRPDGEEVECLEQILKAWKTLKLQKSFVAACKSVPVEFACCRLIEDDEKMTEKLVPYLNEHWVPVVNKDLCKKGLSVDAFLWKWNNINGRATTSILLIRFYERKNPK